MNLSPTRVLKSILLEENNMKDPFRVKKAVIFTIAYPEDDEEAEKAEDDKKDDELIKPSSPEGSKKIKTVVVNATDEIELPKKKKNSIQLSKEQRNS